MFFQSLQKLILFLQSKKYNSYVGIRTELLRKRSYLNNAKKHVDRNIHVYDLYD